MQQIDVYYYIMKIIINLRGSPEGIIDSAINLLNNYIYEIML